MHNIQEIITQNFNDNIKYFEINHPDIFTKLLAFDNAVEKGLYQNRYELIYENGFDVIEIKSDTILYAKDSKFHTKEVLKKIILSTMDDTFVCFNQTDMKNKVSKLFSSHEQGIQPIQKLTITSNPIIEKYIFFGVGLGLHISCIIEKLQMKNYLIVEDDLELFRLSLFCTNYKKLSQNVNLYFAIFDDDFTKKAREFIEIEYHQNHFIKYFRLLSHSDTKIYDFYLQLTLSPHLRYFYNDLLHHIVKPLPYFLNGYSFLSKEVELPSYKPYILLAAGLSLEKEIEWLKDNKDQFIVVALSATLVLLEKYNIIPDIVVHLDAFENGKIHFQNLKTLDFLKNTLLFFSASLDKDLVDMFQKEQIFFYESGTSYNHNSLKLSAACVGSLSYQLLLRLGVKELYLLGLDLSVDSKTNQTHISTHAFNEIANQENQEKLQYKQSLITVNGNFQETIKTTPHFQASIESINLSTKAFKTNQQVIYNLSDGAYFDQIQSLDKNKISIKTYHIDFSLKNFIFSTSVYGLTSLEEKMKFLKEFELKVLIFQKQTFQNYGEYLIALESFYKYFVDDTLLGSFELSRVFDLYFQSVLHFIFAIEDGEYLAVHTFFTQHLLDIITFYKQRIEI